ncbi:MAG: glucose 1-dehydrogenase [Leptospiraceae bacterium]|nr:glucose 1-dehydrogenase [Leptospiraceae bacterium]
MKGKVALVTGSTSGLGKAVAIEFAKKGANVVVSGRREQEGHQTVLEIEAINLGKAFFCRCDVSILEDVQNLIQFTIAKFGFLHFAVNNAAIGGQTKKLADYSLEEYKKVISVNLDGTFYCMKYQIPELLKTKGSMVNVSSIGGHRGQKHGIAPYSASKHGIIGLTKCAALEYGDQGLRINVVCPAGMETEMNESLYEQYPDPEKAKKERDKSYALGRIADPKEVAKTVVWLCTDDASFITGATIPIDGGKTA